MKQRFFLILITLAFFSNSFGKQVGVFVNSEASMGVINSMHYCCDIAGFPIVLFSDVDSISTQFFDVVFLATLPVLESRKFGQNCNSFVTNGGFLFGDRDVVSEGKSQLYSLFGISGVNRTNVHTRVNINTDDYPEEARWLDDEMEQWFQLCSSDKTFYYVNELILDGASVMATYGDNTVAITENRQGAGRAYYIGLSLKHILLFPRMNKDLQAERVFSNGFEPAADIIPLLFRGIIETHFDDAGWKYTLPTDAEGVVCITHDIDSKKGFEEGRGFADYEELAGIVGQYNITTRYFRDDILSDFYIKSDGKGFVNYVLDKGHIVSSHTVGNFYDMADVSIFAIGDKTVTQENYNPYYLSSIGHTVGGTIYGELLVSKEILENDGVPNVNSIRIGHLSFSKYFPEVMEDCGYLYSSCLSANDVLTGFPFKLIKTLSSTNPFSNVMEVPINLSDEFRGVSMSASNWPDKVNTWLAQTERYTGNHAPVVLQIHPNAQYKNEAQQKYFRNLPMDVDVVSFIDVADFWVKRSAFRWTSSVDNDTLLIRVPDELFPIGEAMRVMLPNGAKFSDVRVEKESGVIVTHNLIPHKRGLLLEFKEAENEVQFVVKSDNECISDAVVVIEDKPLSDPFTNVNGRLVVKGLSIHDYDYTVLADGYNDYHGRFSQERKSFVSVMLVPFGGADSQEASIEVYPIPVRDLLYVDVFNMDMPNITIFSLQGAVIKSIISSYHEVRVDVSDLERGLYFVQVKDGHKSVVQKFMVK